MTTHPDNEVDKYKDVEYLGYKHHRAHRTEYSVHRE